MKILAVSDEVSDAIYTPLLKQKYGDVDLVLGCGDLPYFYLEFIVNALDVPVYYVPGNHDQQAQYLNDGRTVYQAEGCVLLDGQTAGASTAAAATARAAPATAAPAFASASAAVVVTPPWADARLLVAGLGGCLRYNEMGQHQYTQSEMYWRAYALSPALVINRLRFGRFLDIMLTHAPPRGIHDRPTQAHTGLDAFLWLMRTFKPRLWLHGHTHRYRQDVPTVSRYLETEVVNVYPYRVIEWKV